MTGTVLRAGAWPAVAGISGAAVVVGGCGVAFPAAATVLLPVCFALLAAAAAFTLDEPASLVVDVTPTGPVRRTGIRAVALLAPLAAGALVMLAAAIRGLALPWAATGLALAGNVLLGFAAACVARTRTGEPGATTGTAVVLVLVAPSLVPHVARWVRTFPAPGTGGPSSDTVWWTVLAVCAVAIAVSVGGRNLPRGCSRFRYPGDGGLTRPSSPRRTCPIRQPAVRRTRSPNFALHSQATVDTVLGDRPRSAQLSDGISRWVENPDQPPGQPESR
jgi:hypothetical protein